LTVLKYVSRLSELPSDRLVKKAFNHASSVNTLWWQKLSLWLSQHGFEGVLAEGTFSLANAEQHLRDKWYQAIFRILLFTVSRCSSNFPAGRLLQQPVLLAVMPEMWQRFDASPVMSGQLPKQQDTLSDACSVSWRPDAFMVMPHVRCLLSCATGQMPSQLLYTSDALSVVLQARCLHGCATHHMPSQLSPMAESPPKQQHVVSLAACASKHQVLATDAGFSPQLRSF